MTEALFLMGGLGVVIGIILAAASKIFYVYVDPQILEVEDVLPGANCGGCGLPGCSSNAEAIVAGKATPNSCVAAGEDVAEAIAAIMGVSIEAKEPDIALPGCTYGVQDADVKFIYDGLNDCRAAALLNGGMKVCSIGCLGLGSCVRACQFGALAMGDKGLPVVNEEKCTGCGACEKACPKNIINLSSVTRRIMREYTTDNCTTPCQRACPAGIDICEYIRQIGLGDYHKAVLVIKERNPFPTVIGRICPRPCEDMCRRHFVDEPVAINFLKRFAADYEKEIGERVLPYKAPSTGRKVAVIGGGIEGLSTAFFAARLGHALTVFEASPHLGGLLRSAIAKERLPAEMLDWDIDGVLEMGVEARTEQALGKDFTIDSLLTQDYDAVFLAAGGWDSRLARGKSGEIDDIIPGTFLLLDFLNADQETTCKSDVVIVGGGKLGADAAVNCKKKGASDVTFLLREAPDASALNDEDLSRCEAEGIKIIYNAAISHIFGISDELTEIEITDSETGSKSTIQAKTLILASGRYPELVFTRPEAEAESGESEDAAPLTDHWVGTPSYKKPDYDNEKGLLAKGDALSDYSAAIKAIGGGRRAAASLHQIMYAIDMALPCNVLTLNTVIQNVDDVESVETQARLIMPISSPQELAQAKELEKGFSPEMAKAEADRCLQCGLICYEHSETVTIEDKMPVAA
ncbi:FAD-dependent oxidoreductase [Desulfococcaceae bacterium HSG9]|nr:FAD-dependent oxidoreductase [Desulfococcaceae bacterium HSG9]